MASKLPVDVLLMSRPQHQVSASFNRLFLVSRHQSLIATSLYGSAGFTCWFLMSRHQSLVATSAPRIATFNSACLMSRHPSLVATSTLYLLRLLLLFFGVATSVFCRDSSLSFSSFINPNLSYLQGASVVATSISSHDINSCRSLMMLSRRHSLSFWLLFTCLSGTSCRDFHKTPSMILMSRPHNLDCVSRKLHR